MLENQLEITPVENNQTYYGIVRESVKKCTESIAGTKGCAEFTANGDGKVIVTLSVETGFITLFKRNFVFNSDKTFEFKTSDGKISLKISITDFELKNGRINFTVAMNFCLGSVCVGEAKFNISIPVPIAREGTRANLSYNDDYLLHLLLALHENKPDCNCK